MEQAMLHGSCSHRSLGYDRSPPVGPMRSAPKAMWLLGMLLLGVISCAILLPSYRQGVLGPFGLCPSLGTDYSFSGFSYSSSSGHGRRLVLLRTGVALAFAAPLKADGVSSNAAPAGDSDAAALSSHQPFAVAADDDNLPSSDSPTDGSAPATTDFFIAFSLGLGAPSLLPGGGDVRACTPNTQAPSCVGGIAAFAAFARAIIAETNFTSSLPEETTTTPSPTDDETTPEATATMPNATTSSPNETVTESSNSTSPSSVPSDANATDASTSGRHDESDEATAALRRATAFAAFSNTDAFASNASPRPLLAGAYAGAVDAAAVAIMPEIEVDTPFVQMHPDGLAVNLAVYRRAGIVDTYFAYPSFFTQQGVDFAPFFASTDVLPVACNLDPPSSSRWRSVVRAYSVHSIGGSGPARMRVAVTRALQMGQAWVEATAPALVATIQNMRTVADIVVVLCGDVDLPSDRLLPLLGEAVPDLLVDRSGAAATSEGLGVFTTPGGKRVLTGTLSVQSSGAFYQLVVKKTVATAGESPSQTTAPEPTTRRPVQRWEDFPAPTPGATYAVESAAVLLAAPDNALAELPDAYKDAQYWAFVDYLAGQAALASRNDPILTFTNVAVPPSRTDLSFPCFQGECAQGTLCARSYWWRYGADFGMINAGGPRGPGWAAGPVKTSDVWALIPFRNYPCIGRVLGLKVWELVNASMAYCTFSSEYGSTADRFMQTYGLEIDYDRSEAATIAGTRVRAIRVFDRETNTYKPLERLKYYTFATDTYQCTSMPVMAALLRRAYAGEVVEPSASEEVAQTMMQSFLKSTFPLYTPTIVGYLAERNASDEFDWRPYLANTAPPLEPSKLPPTTIAPATTTTAEATQTFTTADGGAPPSEGLATEAERAFRRADGGRGADSALAAHQEGIASRHMPPMPSAHLFDGREKSRRDNDPYLSYEYLPPMSTEEVLERIRSLFMLWGETAASCNATQRWEASLGSCLPCPPEEHQDRTDPSRCVPDVSTVAPRPEDDEGGSLTWVAAPLIGLVLLVLLSAAVVGVLVRRLRTGVRNTQNAPKGREATIIFTDIQMSTKLWGTVPASMAVALDQHHAMIRDAIAECRGYEVKTVGDSFMIAVDSPELAVAMAMRIQLSLFTAAWPRCINLVYAAEGCPLLVDCIDDDPTALSTDGIELKRRSRRRRRRGGRRGGGGGPAASLLAGPSEPHMGAGSVNHQQPPSVFYEGGNSYASAAAPLPLPALTFANRNPNLGRARSGDIICLGVAATPSYAASVPPPPFDEEQQQQQQATQQRSEPLRLPEGEGEGMRLVGGAGEEGQQQRGGLFPRSAAPSQSLSPHLIADVAGGAHPALNTDGQHGRPYPLQKRVAMGVGLALGKGMAVSDAAADVMASVDVAARGEGNTAEGSAPLTPHALSLSLQLTPPQRQRSSSPLRNPLATCSRVGSADGPPTSEGSLTQPIASIHGVSPASVVGSCGRPATAASNADGGGGAHADCSKEQAAEAAGADVPLPLPGSAMAHCGAAKATIACVSGGGDGSPSANNGRVQSGPYSPTLRTAHQLITAARSGANAADRINPNASVSIGSGTFGRCSPQSPLRQALAAASRVALCSPPSAFASGGAPAFLAAAMGDGGSERTATAMGCGGTQINQPLFPTVTLTVTAPTAAATDASGGGDRLPFPNTLSPRQQQQQAQQQQYPADSGRQQSCGLWGVSAASAGSHQFHQQSPLLSVAGVGGATGQGGGSGSSPRSLSVPSFVVVSGGRVAYTVGGGRAVGSGGNGFHSSSSFAGASGGGDSSNTNNNINQNNYSNAASGAAFYLGATSSSAQTNAANFPSFAGMGRRDASMASAGAYGGADTDTESAAGGVGWAPCSPNCQGPATCRDPYHFGQGGGDGGYSYAYSNGDGMEGMQPLIDSATSSYYTYAVEEERCAAAKGPPAPAISRHFNGLRVRIGIHCGPVDAVFDEIAKGYDYYGPTVNVAARVESTADGGQIIVSRDVANALPPPPPAPMALATSSIALLPPAAADAVTTVPFAEAVGVASMSQQAPRHGGIVEALSRFADWALCRPKPTATGVPHVNVHSSSNTNNSRQGGNSPLLQPYQQRLLGAVQLKGVVGLTELLEIAPVALLGRVFTASAVETAERLREADNNNAIDGVSGGDVDTLSRAASSAMLSLTDREADLKEAISRVFQPLRGSARARFGDEIAKAWRIHLPRSLSEKDRFEKTMRVLSQRISSAAGVGIGGGGGGPQLPPAAGMYSHSLQHTTGHTGGGCDTPQLFPLPSGSGNYVYGAGIHTPAAPFLQPPAPTSASSAPVGPPQQQQQYSQQQQQQWYSAPASTANTPHASHTRTQSAVHAREASSSSRGWAAGRPRGFSGRALSAATSLPIVPSSGAIAAPASGGGGGGSAAVPTSLGLVESASGVPNNYSDANADPPSALQRRLGKRRSEGGGLCPTNTAAPSSSSSSFSSRGQGEGGRAVFISSDSLPPTGLAEEPLQQQQQHQQHGLKEFHMPRPPPPSALRGSRRRAHTVTVATTMDGRGNRIGGGEGMRVGPPPSSSATTCAASAPSSPAQVPVIMHTSEGGACFDPAADAPPLCPDASPDRLTPPPPPPQPAPDAARAAFDSAASVSSMHTAAPQPSATEPATGPVFVEEAEAPPWPFPSAAAAVPSTLSVPQMQNSTATRDSSGAESVPSHTTPSAVHSACNADGVSACSTIATVALPTPLPSPPSSEGSTLAPTLLLSQHSDEEKKRCNGSALFLSPAAVENSADDDGPIVPFSSHVAATSSDPAIITAHPASDPLPYRPHPPLPHSLSRDGGGGGAPQGRSASAGVVTKEKSGYAPASAVADLYSLERRPATATAFPPKDPPLSSTTAPALIACGATTTIGISRTASIVSDLHTSSSAGRKGVALGGMSLPSSSPRRRQQLRHASLVTTNGPSEGDDHEASTVTTEEGGGTFSRSQSPSACVLRVAEEGQHV